MREVDTAIGILTLPKILPQERINAELKGITLFKEIIDTSKLWKLNNAIAKRPRAYCRVGDYKIVLDPFQTLENCYFERNFHLVLSINDRKVCVLESHNSDVAYIDSMISLLLLGEAGWPEVTTPVTMREVSVEQQIIDYYLGRERSKDSMKLCFTAENKEELLQARHEIEGGNSWEGLATIMKVARKKYVCSPLWTMDDVVCEISPYVNVCSEEQISLYFENPFEPADRIFLKIIMSIPNI